MNRAPDSFLAKARPLVMARFACAGMTFLIPLVLARALSLSDFGAYKQLFLVGLLLYFVLPFGMSQSLYFFIPRADERRPYIGQTLIYLGAAGLLAGLGIWVFADTLAHEFGNAALVQYRLPLAIFAGCFIGSSALEISLTSQGKTRQAAVAYLVSDGARAVALMGPVLLGFGLRGMMWSSAVYSVGRLGAAWWVGLAHSEGRLWNLRLFMNQLSYAAPFGAAMVLNVPQQQLHQFVVASQFTPALFAVYAAGCFQLPLVDLLYTPTSEMLMVRLGQLEKEGRREEGLDLFHQASARLSFFFLPMAAFLFAAAPEVIGALFGPKFSDAVPLFRVSVLGVVLATLPMDGVLRALGHTRSIFFSYLIKSVVTVPLVFLGVKWFGLMGGVGSWAVAELVGKATLFARIPAALSTPVRALRWTDVVPWRPLGKAAFAAALAGLSVVGIRQVLPEVTGLFPDGTWTRIFPVAIAGLLFTCGYLGMLWFSGVQPTQVFPLLRWRRGN